MAKSKKTKPKAFKSSATPILFLDIDGILNTDAFLKAHWQGRIVKDYSIYLQSELIEELNRIFLSTPDLKFVIHSNWARFLENKTIGSALKKKGFIYWDRCLGDTPKKMSSLKCNEISWWLAENPDVEEYLVLDDENIIFSHIVQMRPRRRQEHLIFNPEVGLTKKTADIVIAWFKGKNLPKKMSAKKTQSY